MILSRAHRGLCIAACLVSAGCADPEFYTDLTFAGPPRVMTVNVLSESAGEIATFCAQGGDAKVSRLYCPEARDELDNPIPGDRPFATVSDTRPLGWYIRVVFDELLDPDVEELRDDDGNGRLEGHIDNTAPVTLRCGDSDIVYDGFYDPSGNSISDPPGPSLRVNPGAPFPAATGSICQVAMNDVVTDKEGNRVPDAERGPYEFRISPLLIRDVFPRNGTEGVDPTAIPLIAFNAPVSVAGLGEGELIFQDGGGADVTFSPVVPPEDPMLLALVPDSPLSGNTVYSITIMAATGLSDVLGGPLGLDGDLIISFTTGEGTAGQ